MASWAACDKVTWTKTSEIKQKIKLSVCTVCHLKFVILLLFMGHRLNLSFITICWGFFTVCFIVERCLFILKVWMVIVLLFRQKWAILLQSVISSNMVPMQHKNSPLAALSSSYFENSYLSLHEILPEKRGMVYPLMKQIWSFFSQNLKKTWVHWKVNLEHFIA